MLREIAKHAVWLYLKIFIELLQIPDEVVDCLRFLLFIREWHLHQLAMHSTLLNGVVIGICYYGLLLLHN